MREAGSPDCFIVVNGPEDGTEFHIGRSPFLIGQEPQCAVHLRLDNSVLGDHATATAVADGYRIRAIAGAKVQVNGKRAGTVRSRVARPGDYIRVGHTELVLECAPDGLASRSRGIITENDFVWALKAFLGIALESIGALSMFLLQVPLRLFRSWKAFALPALIAAYFFVPQFRDVVWRVLGPIVGTMRNAINQVM